MSYSLTPRQADLLRFIAGYIEAHGVAPDSDEMARAMGRQQRGGSTHGMLLALEERGHIRRLPNRARAIEVLHKPPIPRGPNGEPLYFVRVAV